MFIITLPILLFSVIFHEVAHGWMANRFGDDTARVSGRITFNPLPHIDLFGTVILPLTLIIFQSPFLFGWAKPVPINPYRFYNYRLGTILVSLAGPGSNILLALIFALAAWILKFAGLLLSPIFIFLNYGVIINLLLAFFNLLPIPPLDGSHLFAFLLPSDLAYRYESLAPYGMFIIMILFMAGLFNYLYLLIIWVHRLLFLGII
ncbi:MAG: site-2 protease family protein [Elusimicrobiota bacterium]